MLDKINQQLREAGVEFIRLVWTDNANIIRTKAFHISRLGKRGELGLGISPAQQAVPALYDVVNPKQD